MKKRYLLYIFLYSLSVRLILWIFVVNHPERAFDIDSIGYVKLAESLVDSHTFPSIFRTPGYPFFIAAVYSIFGKFPQAILIFQYLVSSLTAIFVVLIFFRIFQNVRYSHMAGFIYAINPFAIFHSNIILSETLFTFILITAIYIFIIFLQNDRKGYLIVASFLLGIGTLCRPISLYLPLFLLPIIFTVGYKLRHKFANILIFLVVFYIVVVPWCMRNYHTYNSWILSTVGDMNIFCYEAPAVLMIKKEPRTIIQFAINKPIEELQKNMWDKTKRKYGWNNKSPAELSNNPQRTVILKKEGLTVIRETPFIFLLSHLGGVNRTLFPFYPSFDKFLGSDFEIIKLLSFSVDLIIMGLSFLGLILSLKKSETLLSIQVYRIIIVSMIILIFYFSFLPGVIGYSRFRIPIIPYISIFSAFGFWRMSELCKRRKKLV